MIVLGDRTFNEMQGVEENLWCSQKHNLHNTACTNFKTSLCLSNAFDWFLAGSNIIVEIFMILPKTGDI